MRWWLVGVIAVVLAVAPEARAEDDEDEAGEEPVAEHTALSWAYTVLPAISEDGATLALPFLDSETTLDQEYTELVSTLQLVSLGKVTGVELELGAQLHDSDGELLEQSSRVPDVSKLLADQRYSSLRTGTTELDDITMTVSGGDRRQKVVFKRGKKVIASTTIKGKKGEKVWTGRFTYAHTSKKLWVYLEISTYNGSLGRMTTRWSAIKAKPR